MCSAAEVHDAVATAALSTYSSLTANGKPRPRSNRQPEWTVLAAVCVWRAGPHGCDAQCVSLGTGLKALPLSRLPVHGDVLHDSHAEVVARRGFKRWLYTQIERAIGAEGGDADGDVLFVERVDVREWQLKSGFKVGMYISTLPCGDASTYFLSLNIPAGEEAAPGSPVAASPASTEVTATATPGQVHRSLAEAASLGMHTARDPSPGLSPPPVGGGTISTTPLAAVHRGRASYTSFSILRTKPGRADSPPTISHSCSDKLALWSLLGPQGALLSQLGMRRVPLECVVIGGEFAEAERDKIRDECRRAIGGRLETWARSIGLSEDDFDGPDVAFTDRQFEGAREVVAAKQGVAVSEVVGCAESISYIAGLTVEVITNGIRQGGSAKRKAGEPLGPKVRSRLSKLSLYQMHLDIQRRLSHPPSYSEGSTTSFTVPRSSTAPLATLPSEPLTYFAAKHPCSPLSASGETVNLLRQQLSILSPGERYSVLKRLVRLAAPKPTVLPASPSIDTSEGELPSSTLATSTAVANVAARGPFAGWLVSGEKWESFDADGGVVELGIGAAE
ncbi:tRNA-specific adenosine deaminase [Rhodotorula paludigena]|uniref:tRNA-specific adenosine deaminase n=1 Tax=Rhodotorula paludigena TaxID=86838 RepID=UPI0031716363